MKTKNITGWSTAELFMHPCIAGCSSISQCRDHCKQPPGMQSISVMNQQAADEAEEVKRQKAANQLQ